MITHIPGIVCDVVHDGRDLSGIRIVGTALQIRVVTTSTSREVVHAVVVNKVPINVSAVLGCGRSRYADVAVLGDAVDETVTSPEQTNAVWPTSLTRGFVVRIGPWPGVGVVDAHIHHPRIRAV